MLMYVRSQITEQSISPLKSSMEETRWRTTRVSDAVRKHHGVSLRPAPLFRTVGLTGLSAGLPPHRRLRSVTHNNSISSTAAGQSYDLWAGRPSCWFLSDSVSTGARIHQPYTNPLDVSTLTEQTQEKPLANITLSKTPLSQEVHQKQTSPRRQKAKDKEIFINKQLRTVDVLHRRNCGRPNLAQTHGRDTSPVRQKEEEYLFEEVWRGESQTVRWRRRKRNKRVNTDEASDISRWIQRLQITDREKNTPAYRTESHKPQMGFKPKRAVHLGEEEEQTRRDRRPHFLPPITQSDYLLNVPLMLPDNSPPPSPCSPSDVLFFPLSVPHIQPFPLRRETGQ